MIVVWAGESPRSAIISARSRKLSLYRRYQRTQSTMISWSKCRPLKSSSIFVCARQLCRSTDLPTTMLCPSGSHQSLTNNAAERALRGLALGRKSWLFAGSERGAERAAIMYTLIQTAKLNEIDPQAWLADTLSKIAETP